MNDQETRKPKRRSKEPINSVIESIFLKDCRTRRVSPEISRQFKNIKIVTGKSESAKAIRIRPDQYKNMISFLVMKRPGRKIS